MTLTALFILLFGLMFVYASVKTDGDNASGCLASIGIILVAFVIARLLLTKT